ncbi:MAG: 2OG-Fe(II) oxygenase [Acidobacteria bacterium]|nr:2OG-Fe(II) oxygenase [Acidobacteriota bacterium]
MIDLTRITPDALETRPYRWAFIENLFSPRDGEELAATFPRDGFKTVKGYDGEKGYEYEARALIPMNGTAASRAEALSPGWRQLAADLLSDAYREAMSRLTGLNLAELWMEVNVFHYGQSAWLGPHVDLEEKLVTHVLYFNDAWDVADGGCLNILRAGDMKEVEKVIPPLVGNSCVLVRSKNSWHAVSRVRGDSRTSRRSMTVTFYSPGSVSTMWPPGDHTPLHDYRGEPSALGRLMRRGLRRLRSSV